MQREIQFRGKHTKTEIWTYGYYHKVEAMDGVFGYIAWQGNSIPVHLDTVGQFAGIKDQNGKDIYENDILSFEKKEYSYVCMFSQGSFVLYHSNLKDLEGEPLRWGLLSRAFEINMNEKFLIIGNIYDNPEILY